MMDASLPARPGPRATGVLGALPDRPIEELVGYAGWLAGVILIVAQWGSL